MKSNLSKLAVPLGVVGIIMLLIVPVPAPLLDVLIIVNILLALVTLLTTMFVSKPLDFSVFPSLLLVATLFRLGLNVASTRLVLGEAHAGEVINAMGNVAVNGNMIIGVVIFLILVVIQFVVVTKGAERVAEVGARFTLDAMPGKQMAIDAELGAGAITDEEATKRRADVSAEADFYGAMDGSSKFVKGDAIAGIIIIIINMVGGLGIGMLQRGMPIADALSTYSILAIGDGLVTQIPALLMAVSTGMIVTRSNASSDLGSTASKQLSQSNTSLLIGGVAAIAMAFIPGMPPVPFILIGVTLIVLSRKIKASDEKAEAAAAAAALETDAPEKDPAEELMEQMRVHPLEIQLAPDLLDIANVASDDLLGRVKSLRHKVAMDLGVVIPPVRTRDALDLPAGTYAIRIGGVEVGRGMAPSGKVLALGGTLDGLPGIPTIEPVFGLVGKWIPNEMRHSAEITGATVIDRASALITHLSSVIRQNAARLLSREDVRVLTEGVKQVSPSAVEELVPGVLTLAGVQSVLQGLLAEEVPINDLPRIYEALSVRGKVSTDTEGLIEAARSALGPVIAHGHVQDGTLSIVMIDPALEQRMLEGLRPGEMGTQIMIPGTEVEAVLDSLKKAVEAAGDTGRSAVLVCAPALRPAIRRLVSAQANGVPVLSYQEATSANVNIETVGVVSSAHAIAA
ncbi:flagellar biosynthesis protein FlhA [Pseudarthrobacter sp. BIM B-2242]|uniref:flagellar biosynthesis protein FlhA n=1 Tax=Pseudarthrobacter sp. BIM B-2242 TaxID=2772401 RepID=UPI00168B93AD|nr:flagellar biosynthesis protein FlhA [Pseudarthrobacter sp. BIM B-2242]QOD05743.1 FHIPEP family type III secretion protein [Pseudarthrobacter sp. BIM B-2242]